MNMLMSLALLQTGTPSSGRGGMVLLIYAVAFGLIFWFILLRPQRKMQERHRTMLGALKRGDEVLTDGGIIGTIVHLTEDRVTIKTGDNTRLVVARPKIARVMGAGSEENS